MKGLSLSCTIRMSSMPSTSGIMMSVRMRSKSVCGASSASIACLPFIAVVTEEVQSGVMWGERGQFTVSIGLYPLRRKTLFQKISRKNGRRWCATGLVDAEVWRFRGRTARRDVPVCPQLLSSALTKTRVE